MPGMRLLAARPAPQCNPCVGAAPMQARLSLIAAACAVFALAPCSPLAAHDGKEHGKAAKHHAHKEKAGSLTIEAPWARATPAGAKVGGGYLKITNTGNAPDRLVGGS